MLKQKISWLLLIVAFVPLLAHAQAIDAKAQLGVMENILSKFSDNAAKWTAATQTVGLRVFAVLALIEISLKMRKVVLSGGEEGIIRIAGILMTSLMTWGFFLWAMNAPATILGSIVLGFEKLGGVASGMGTLNPTQMIGAGVDLALQMNNSASAWKLLTDPGVAFVVAITEILTIGAFGILGIQMFAALLHYWLLLACAPILLAGGALSFTRDWAIKQFQGAVATGVKIFVIYLVAGVVTEFIPEFKAIIKSGGAQNMAPLLGMCASGIVILFLAFFAPSIASAIMGGTASINGNELAGFGASVAAGGVAAAGMAFGGVAGGVSLAGKAGDMLGRMGEGAGNLGSALGNLTSAGGNMKEAFSTSAGGGGRATSGAMDMAKRVGGDLPSGMSPISQQSKALLGGDGGGSGSGSSGGGSKAPTTGVPQQGSQSSPSSNTSSAASGSSTTRSASAPSSQAASVGGNAGSSGITSGAGDSGNSTAQSVDGSRQTPTSGESAPPIQPGVTQLQSGDATTASIGGNTIPSSAPPQSKIQQIANAGKTASDAVGKKLHAAKGFIPEQNASGTLHINMSE
ncbi:P-type conjugative transfer protein TrbL [Caballeronia sordidicola]|nr:P-type conjugative transfer protein TrbL [Caballeronia sordidicola]